jgi:23S rRNA (adenine2503-C2)-methyltransferase
MIPDEERLTVCISSQVGCAMGCKYCLTGKLGFTRNLMAGEIASQVLAVEEDIAKDNIIGENGIIAFPTVHGPMSRYITHVVLMGMGEPMLNLKNVLKAIEILTHPDGFNMAPRRITVSTVGIIPQIEKFIAAQTGVRLAVSLTAAENDLRDQLLPVNEKFPLEELEEVLKLYPSQNRKPITFEYVMLKGVNDRPEDAANLVRFARRLDCKINLIPLNESPDNEYRRPDIRVIHKFQDILWESDVPATIRESRGQDIMAACGQLKAAQKE